MYVLTVDTATPQVTAGIVRISEKSSAHDTAIDTAIDTIAFERHLDARAHNEVLTPLIVQCLESAELTPKDLSAVVVGCGPGPFTGLRVGMATAMSFAAALHIPCHGVCSLDSLVADLDSTGGASANAGDILAVTDARRREVYFAAYRNGVRLGEPAVAKAADVLQILTTEFPDFAPQLLVGSDKHCAAVASAAGFEQEGLRIEARYPTPTCLARAAGFGNGQFPESPGPLTPMYLRRPDAVPPKPKPQSPAIPVVDLGGL